MVCVHSSLVIPTHSYGPLASCGWTGPEDLLIFPWKKKNVFRLTRAHHGMPGYCFKFEGYGNGNRSTGVAFSDGRYGGWRVLGLRGSSRNFLDDWFRVGGYFLGDELFFNGAGIGYGSEASFSIKLFVIRSTSSNSLPSNYFLWLSFYFTWFRCLIFDGGEYAGG